MTPFPRGGRRRWVWPALMLWLGPGAPELGAQARADSAWAAGELDLAEDLYRAELERDGANTLALRRLALIRGWSGDARESLTLLDRLLEIAPNDGDARVARARALAWDGRFAEAEAAFRRILEEDPGRRDARLGLAATIAWDGRYREAETLYARLLEQAPDDHEALAGYARVAAWDGRPGEAARRWRRARESRPDDADIAREFRRARLATRPRLEPELSWEGDSDGQRIATVRAGQRVWLGDGVTLRVDGYGRRAEQAGSGLAGRAYGGRVDVEARLAGGWRLWAGPSVHSVAGEGERARAGGSVRLAAPPTAPLRASVLLRRRPLDLTAPLMRARVTVDEAVLGIGAGSGSGLLVEAEAGWAAYRGERVNRRLAGTLSLAGALGDAWVGSVRARAFGFDEDTGDPYFDPELYASLQAGLEWRPSGGPWEGALGLFPGIQRVTRGSSSTSPTVEARGRVGLEVAPGRVVRLETTFSTTALRSFSSGGSGYRYLSAGLSLSWTF